MSPVGSACSRLVQFGRSCGSRHPSTTRKRAIAWEGKQRSSPEPDEGLAAKFAALEARLAARSGIVESGLFIGIADEALIASDEGVRTMARDE